MYYLACGFFDLPQDARNILVGGFLGFIPKLRALKRIHSHRMLREGEMRLSFK